MTQVTSHILLAALALSILTSPGCQIRIPEQAGISSPAPDPSVTIVLLGDVMLGRGVHPGPETFAYLKPFLTSADLALANLESPLTGVPAQSESPYVLCAPPENVSYLLDAGFDYMALANNHRLDCGEDGLRETQKTLAEAGLGFVGPGSEPVYRSVHGVPLALLAFDATEQFDLETAIGTVRSAREAGYLVVVSVHWGAEYQAGESASLRQIAGQLANAGAALIWGHHPHVLQPSEWIHERQTLVFYSLGNALFDQYGLEATRRSALALVTLTTGGVEDYEIIPFVIDVGKSRVEQAGQQDTEVIQRFFR